MFARAGAALIGALTLPGMASAALLPNHIWDLDHSLADALGGPNLALQNDATLGATGVTITVAGNHSGIVLQDAIGAFTSSDVYSVEMLWTPGQFNDYKRLLNTGDHGDSGFYSTTRNSGSSTLSRLSYYVSGPTYGTTTFAPDTPLHIVFARDASNMFMYLNGSLELTRAAHGSADILDSMLFFIDNDDGSGGSSEEAKGFADFIRTYDYRLSDTDVSGLWNRGAILPSSTWVTSSVPEPASWAMMIGGLGLVGGAMRRRTSLAAA